MNGTVFIDTAGWLALINRKDELHAQAVDVYRSLGRVSRITAARLSSWSKVHTRVALLCSTPDDFAVKERSGI